MTSSSSNDTARVGVRDLHAFITDAYLAKGLPRADAEKAAHLMVEADLAGADAHGVFRLPQYVQRI